MMVLFVSLVHINAWIYYFIGKNEYGKHHRFDGQTLFSDIVNRPFLDFKPVLGMSLKEKYWHFIFLATWTVGCSIFGDVIPFTPIEIIFTIFLTFFSRIFVAFIYAIVSDYISSIYLTYSNHIESNSLVINYLELHNMPTELKKRVNKYYEILWDNFKGMNDDEIMGDLPESIAKQMKLFVFSSFTEKLTIFPKEDKAAITSLLTRLKIRLVPEGEYIIREREIRDCIYFIIRGSVLIVSGGVVLATLEQGAVFGEMAIAEKIPTVRNASAFWITPVWVGSLSIEDFKIIWTSYPSFEEKIQIEVSKRKADNLTKTPNVKPVEQSKIASSSKRPSKLVNNFEKSKSAMSRLSKDSSKKGSRQGVYEMEEEEKGENRILLNSLQSKFTQNYYEKKQSKVKTNTISEINYLKIQQEDPENQSLKQSVGNIEIKVWDWENPNVPNIANLANDNASNGILHRSWSNNSQNNSLKSSGVPSLDLSHDDIENKIVKETHSNWKWFKIIYRSLLILIQIYNIVFIPLQGGFRIKFSPGLIVMEIFTILLYIIDIFLLIIKYKRIQRKLNKIGVEVNVSNRVVWRTTDADQKELNILKIYFVPSIISWFPFAMIFSFAGVDNPSLLIYFIKITRLMKIWPLKSFLRYLKRNYLKITRVAEVIIQ